MATKTSKYELQKKEDNDFYNIEDLNANWDKVENALTEFDDSGTAEGITSFTDMLAKLVTGNKLAVTLRNLKAGLQFVLHTGSIVNNCVTDNAKLPLSAAQGKALQDAITKLNGDLSFGYLRAKIKNTEIVAVVETFAFNNGSALKPFSTWFNYTPDYARGICSPVSINGSLAAAGAGRSGTNLKVDLADSNYTGTIWVSMILVASSN